MPPLHPHAQTHVPHGFSRGPSPHLAADALDPVADIESSQIMALLVADGVNWVDAARRYFDYVHPWMSVVHFDLFNARVAPALAGTNGAGGVYGPALAARWEPTPSLALLLVCMHLVTRTRPWEMPGGGTPGIPQLHPNGHSYFEAHNRASPTPSSAQGSSPPRAESILSEPIYRTTKRLFGLLTSTSEPSVDLIQCGILLALLEHGNGNSRAGYRTLAQAVAMARIIGIAPGKYEGPDHGSSDGSLDVVGSPGGGSPPPISSISSLLSPSPIADNANTAAILRTDYYSSHPTAPPFQPQPQSVQEEEQNRALWWGLFILDQYVIFPHTCLEHRSRRLSLPSRSCLRVNG